MPPFRSTSANCNAERSSNKVSLPNIVPRKTPSGFRPFIMPPKQPGRSFTQCRLKLDKTISREFSSNWWQSLIFIARFNWLIVCTANTKYYSLLASPRLIVSTKLYNHPVLPYFWHAAALYRWSRTGESVQYRQAIHVVWWNHGYIQSQQWFSMAWSNRTTDRPSVHRSRHEYNHKALHLDLRIIFNNRTGRIR